MDINDLPKEQTLVTHKSIIIDVKNLKKIRIKFKIILKLFITTIY